MCGTAVASGLTRAARRALVAPRGWSLRTRLLAALTALLAVISCGIGAISVLALDRLLLQRVDDSLTAAVARSRTAFDRSPPGRSGFGGVTSGRCLGGPGFLFAPGQAEGTLGANLSADWSPCAAVLDSSGEPRALSDAQIAALTDLPVDARPRSRDLGDRLGDYRLIAVRVPDGDVIVTGLPLSGVHATVYRLAAIVAVVALAGLVVTALAGAAIIRFTLRPLRRVAGTAGRVAQLKLDRGEVAVAERVHGADADPRTEVGQVGAALNRMLEHVAAALAARQASESRVRQFVADASHELRTPLASIRGYAELTRRAEQPVPPELAHVLRRVEAEAVRMTALVEDLLLLARLDAGRPLDRQAVDLSRLVVDAVSDAHAAGPGHRWRLDLPDEPITVPADPPRLHQVVANLLTNARVHTPAGTTVTTSLAVEPPRPGRPPADGEVTGTAVLRVADDGPGIPPELVPEVFERFARGDSSRSRAAGSTGLGLAIVAAVVAAHGGTVAVDTAPGRTAFTVRLPLASQPTGRPERSGPDTPGAEVAVGTPGRN